MEKYEKVKVIGKGSFGSAILVRRRTDRVLFVAKEINISAMTPQEREEARQEFRLLQQVKHPNIIRYVEHIETKTRLNIIMEYADGGDLYTVIKNTKGKLSEDLILRYFSQTCLAVQHLHEQYILHRDIKTMNIFLTSSGVVKLGDFGVATVLRNTMALARTVCGTPYYFSPELCRNSPYNNKSDVWALGCVLYEMCTLRNAFDGVNMKALVAKILKGIYPPLPSPYSSELRNLVAAMLQRAPLQRPGINQVLGFPIMRKALDVLQTHITHATHNRKPPVAAEVPRPSPPPVVVPVAVVAPMLIAAVKVSEKPRGNILRAPHERVKAWQEERERERVAKKEAENRKKLDVMKAQLDEAEQVRAQGWLQQRNERRRLEQAQRDADARSVMELDNQLRRAVDVQNKARDRGQAELRQWQGDRGCPQAMGAEVEKMAWGVVRRSASVNSPSKGAPPPRRSEGRPSIPYDEIRLPLPREVGSQPRHGRRSHSTSHDSSSVEEPQLPQETDFVIHSVNKDVMISPNESGAGQGVDDYLVMQAHIRDIFSRPAGGDVEFGDEATIDPGEVQDNEDPLDDTDDESEDTLVAVDISMDHSASKKRASVANLVHSLFPAGGGDSVHNRAEIVRMHLDSLLGTETFVRAYRVLEHLSPESTDDDIVTVVQGILGQEFSFLIPLLTQLIVCDEEANTQS